MYLFEMHWHNYNGGVFLHFTIIGTNLFNNRFRKLVGLLPYSTGFSIDYYTSILEFQQHFLDTACILIDWDVCDITGLNCVTHIRQMGFTGNIVICLSKSDSILFNNNLYSVSFMIKPLSENSIIDIFKEMYSGNNRMYCLRSSNRVLFVEYNKIVYFSTSNHYVNIVMTHSVDRQRISLERLELSLPDYFVRIHRSYIVNKYFIREFNKNSVILLTGEELPVSRLKYLNIATMF